MTRRDDDTTGPIQLIPFAERSERTQKLVLDQLERELPTLSHEYRLIVEYLSIEMTQRLSEIDSRKLAAADSMPRQIRELAEELRETRSRVAELEDYRLTLTGKADRNGRIGELSERVSDLEERVPKDLQQRIPVSAHERSREKSTLATVSWIGLKLLGFVSIIAGLIGVAAMKVQSKYDHVVEQRVRDQVWRDGVGSNFDRLDHDVDRLFNLFNLKRTE